jgi:hypothetical protein
VRFFLDDGRFTPIRMRMLMSAKVLSLGFCDGGHSEQIYISYFDVYRHKQPGNDDECEQLQ